MIQKLYNLSPHLIQNLFVSVYNFVEYRKRYGGNYQKYLDKFINYRRISYDELKGIQNERFISFLDYTLNHSKFYIKLYEGIELPQSIDEIHRFPIVDKEMLRKNIDDIYTIDSKSGIHSKTGGTTGKSLEVLFTPENMQERFAMLDHFRGQFGYELGKRTAWFSGKNLLNDRDIRKNRFWKTDYWYNVRYYSTFHIKQDYLKHYVEDLIRFKPEYMVGFPSSILEIARYGLKNGYSFPSNTVKAVYPTAETITLEMRRDIENFFQTRMYNQYASSEGAPWIFECCQGNLHIEMQSGVFEVLDDNDQPTNSGRLVVTSFTTEGTPLIRYDIGDQITLDDPDLVCNCGNNNPMVKEILGRIDDFVFSPENGKINLGNVSNTLKDTKGIIKFQAVQDELNELEIMLVVDDQIFDKSVQQKFVQNWRDRIGNKMELIITIVDDIPSEISGKFRMVRNNIKHLVDG